MKLSTGWSCERKNHCYGREACPFTLTFQFEIVQLLKHRSRKQQQQQQLQQRQRLYRKKKTKDKHTYEENNYLAQIAFPFKSEYFEISMMGILKNLFIV